MGAGESGLACERRLFFTKFWVRVNIGGEERSKPDLGRHLKLLIRHTV